jgi:hypothetical protein
LITRASLMVGGFEMTLTISLDEDLEQQLNKEAPRHGLSVAEYSARIIAQHVQNSQRSEATVQLLESWLNGDAVEQQATGQALVQALDEDRLSSRPLFPPEAKGVTW